MRGIVKYRVLIEVLTPNLEVRARVEFLVFEVNAFVVTLIVFVIKRIVFKGGLIVGLVCEISASRV